MRTIRWLVASTSVLVWLVPMSADQAGGSRRGAAPAAPAPTSVMDTATTIAFTEGPAVDRDGNVYFTELVFQRIMRLSAAGVLTVYREQSNNANGLLIDPQGRLIACEGAESQRMGVLQKFKPQITRTDLRTGTIEVLADHHEGKPFVAPNDVTIDGKGRLYFTDLTGGAVYRAALRHLAPMGRLVMAGASAAFPRSRNPLARLAALRHLPMPSIFDMLRRSYGVMAFHVGWLLDSGAALPQWNDLVRFVEQHGIAPVVGQELPFEQIADAHRALEERRNIGKVVVRVSTS